MNYILCCKTSSNIFQRTSKMCSFHKEIKLNISYKRNKTTTKEQLHVFENWEV